MDTAWTYGVVLVLALLGLNGAAFGQGEATLSGRVTDAQDGSSIHGADIALYKMGRGGAHVRTVTDTSGQYRVDRMVPGAYRVEVRALGYRTAQRRLMLRAGEAGGLRLALSAAAAGPETGAPMPPHRFEDIRPTPTPVTGIGHETLQRRVAPSVTGALRAVPGVAFARIGLDRRALAVRGFNSMFSDRPLVLVDDRPAGLPALGANVFSLMPMQPVDVKRVDVVRGPSATRYGPGAASGAIHVVTKDPFDDPGTDLAITGGQRQFLYGQFRHAADIGGTFGYEVTAHAAHGTDWQLDPSDPADRLWLAHDYVFDDLSRRRPGQVVDTATGQLLRDPNYWKAGIRGRFAYRLGGHTTVAAQGGYASLTGRLLSEMGAMQARFLGYSFGQVRVQSGGLFAQVVLNNNEAGASYLYGTGQPIMDRGVAYGTQLRYRFEKPSWATAFTVGTDGRWVRPRTARTLMGRYEASDAIDRYGAYGQANTALTARLNLSLALRADVDNLSQTLWPATRAAVAYDVARAHTIRLRYERATAAPRVRTHFMDMEARRQTLSAPYDLVHRVQGAAEGVTFSRYRREGQATSLLPGSERFGRPLDPSALPLRALYETAATRFEPVLADPATRPGAADALTPVQRQQLAASLQTLADRLTPEDRTVGTLGVPHGAIGYRPVDPPADVPPLARPIVQAVEVGYDGQIGRRVQLRAEAYLATTKNAVRPAEVVTPLVYASRLEPDLESALEPLIVEAVRRPGAPLGDLLAAMGLSASDAARLTARLAERALDGAPVGVVQPDPPGRSSSDSITEQAVLITYRNADRIHYAGADVHMQAAIRDRAVVTGALTFMHPYLVGRAKGNDNDPRMRLNAPRLTAHLGVDIDVTDEWGVQAAGHYTASHPMRVGLYAGTVAAAYPLDVGLRYDAQRYVPGLRVLLTIQNVLNQRHRGTVGAPATGRMAQARITYTL